MKDEKEYSKSRFIELSKMSYERGVYTFSAFLTLAEQSDLQDIRKELFGTWELFGGFEEAERRMVRFGSPHELGYTQEYPISCVKITPLQLKFAEQLSHRDYLGSLMNLGIERDKLGDIVIKGDAAYVFVEDILADFLCEQLTRVRHTSVMTTVVKDAGELPHPELLETSVSIKSERLDAVIAKVYNLSRSQSAELFSQQKVFCDGRLMENESHTLSSGAIVSVRGFGRFVYDGVRGTSKKGNLYANVRIYR